MSPTPNHGYETPQQGSEDWHLPLNGNFETLDADVELRDDGTPDANGYDPVAGGKYLDTASGVVYVSDGSNWTAAFALPASNGSGIASLSGDLTGGTTLIDIAGNNLTIDSNGRLNATTSGGGISGLSGGDGIDPASIGDGDTLSVAWSDAVGLGPNGELTGSDWTVNSNDVLEIADSSVNGITVSQVKTTLVSAETGPLEVVVGGDRVLELRAKDSGDAGTVLLGNSANSAGGVVGATISGGGRDSNTNAANADYGTVGGGYGNTVGLGATISGGIRNAASGDYSAIGGGSDNAATGQYTTVGGGEQNTADAIQATVCGGGSNDATSVSASVGGGQENVASGDSSTVGGGKQNTASGASSAIGGGQYNTASALFATIAGGGPSNLSNPDATNNVVYDNYGTIGGGGDNQAGTDDGDSTTNPGATVGGGTGNLAKADSSTVGGGAGNSVRAVAATIAGGGNNLSTGKYGSVGGGNENEVLARYGTIAGGGFTDLGDPPDTRQAVNDEYGTIGGGGGNIAGPNGGDGKYATVSGGRNNYAGAPYASIGGGGPTDTSTLLDSNNTRNAVYDEYGTVGGGGNNQAGSDDGDQTTSRYATVAGGRGNEASGEESAVGGGAENAAQDTSTTVGGGFNNTADGPGATVAGGGSNDATARDATVAGGTGNESSAQGTTVAGGESNVANTQYATVGGGQNNTASGSHAFAAGWNATASNDGAFVVGDSTSNSVSSDAADQAVFQQALVSRNAITTGGSYEFSGVDTSVSTGTDGLGNPTLEFDAGSTSKIASVDNEGSLIAAGKVQAFGDSNGLAGDFSGDLDVSGTVTADSEYGFSGVDTAVSTGTDGLGNPTLEFGAGSTGKTAYIDNEGSLVAAGKVQSFGDSNGVAGDFSGDVAITGTVTANSEYGFSDVDTSVSADTDSFGDPILDFNAGSTSQTASIDNEGSLVAAGKVQTFGDSNGLAGDFSGDVDVSGTVTAGGEYGFSDFDTSVLADFDSFGDPVLDFDVGSTSAMATIDNEGSLLAGGKVQSFGDSNGEAADFSGDVNVDGNVTVDGDFDVINGNKNFVEAVETDDGEKEIVYTATEAGTPRTEASGVAELDDGRTAVDLPEHFGLVTSDDEPLIVETTPYSADSGGLAVVERSTDRLVIEDLAGDGDYEFAYTVKGTRDGHEDKQIVREPSTDATAESPSPADD